MTTNRSIRASAKGLASGAVTATDLVHAARLPDGLHAVERAIEAAIGDAAASDRRHNSGAPLSDLDGIPFAIKANLEVAGVPTTAGTGLSTPVANVDASAVATLRATGMIPALTATLAEAAVGSVTDNPHTGSCRNPRNPALNAGGSSGGSAALVALGRVPLALGSDTMGSVRIPAAYCGVVAWKPSRGAICTRGLIPLHPLLDTVGLVAATAADLTRVQPLFGPLRGRRPSLTTPLRVGVPGLVELADDEGRAALDAVLDGLSRLGYERRSVDLGIDPAHVRRRGLLLCEIGAYAYFRDAVDRDDPGLSPGLRALLRYGADAPATRVSAAFTALYEAERSVAGAFRGLTVLALPTTPAGPPRVGMDSANAADLAAWVNVAGLPAVALPAGPVTGDGMPRSVQLIGHTGDDVELLALAVQVEQVMATS